jgi:hypothetical protein
MSASKLAKVFPTWRGMAHRPAWRDGSDVARTYDSWLGAKIADTVIYREASRLTGDEIPGCWAATFRGAMAQLNLNLWALNIQAAKGILS